MTGQKAITIRKVRGRGSLTGWRIGCNERYCKDQHLVNPFFTPVFTNFDAAIQGAYAHLKIVHGWRPGDPTDE